MPPSMRALISQRLVLVAGKKGSSLAAVVPAASAIFVQVCTPVQTVSFVQSLRFESSVGAASKKHNLLLAGAHLDVSYAACWPAGYLPALRSNCLRARMDSFS